ncbi:hypothetical protein SLEP1_g40458 [Rubroshorea leprosula]|uniref:Uncharacterized protein n=1 Tax=Rubroshorea leprosula TaxID=152421 RepID=A0AAV5L3X4_9ROSI|nr:hypothetical protein SLEP1_g40458 [Rubroshorea leprosula]
MMHKVRELADLERVERPPARKERVSGGEGGTVEGEEQSAGYGDLLIDRMGEEQRGTDNRWNGGKEDLVSNRAGFDEPSGCVCKGKNSGRWEVYVVEQRGTPLPSCPQSADIKSAALCCVVTVTVAF